jgi:hypothetical protein
LRGAPAVLARTSRPEPHRQIDARLPALCADAEPGAIPQRAQLAARL